MNKEAKLLQLARRLDGNALAEIYDAHSDALYRYAMRLLGDASVAEDCVSESFARFLAALKKGKGPREHLKAYLFRIAHNWITDYYRRAAPDTEPVKEELHLEASDNPAQEAFKNMQMERTRAALKKLTPDQREVIVLRFFEGLENIEIAYTMRRPIGAVKSLQHRALANLKRILLDEDDE